MNLVGIILCGLGIAFATPAFAAEWYLIPGTVNWYGDWSRIKVDKTGIVTIWVKSVDSQDFISKIQKQGEDFSNYSQTLIYYSVNCQEESIADVQSTYYDKWGRPIKSLNLPKIYTVVTPGSYGESLFKAVCPKQTAKE